MCQVSHQSVIHYDLALYRWPLLPFCARRNKRAPKIVRPALKSPRAKMIPKIQINQGGIRSYVPKRVAIAKATARTPMYIFVTKGIEPMSEMNVGELSDIGIGCVTLRSQPAELLRLTRGSGL